MSSKSMYGVVLWTNADDRKAVIWCEDHGDLAFYTPGAKSALEGVFLDAGDLVQFDMRQEANLRYARNPQLVRQSQYPGLAQRLAAGPQRPAQRGPGAAVGNVVPIQPYVSEERRAVPA
ncbi:hypothetical protein ACOXXX_00205 [Thalassococcus sp. BH17M4-6]|uniref:hypothetical protein n=1 Tax=Thalassococcus sp. BH17M4-6 TaxID=3413148 RepID=UPI003BCA5557